MVSPRSWCCLPIIVALCTCAARPEPVRTPAPTQRSAPPEKDYERPLPPGSSALRKLPRDQWPDLLPACRGLLGDRTLLQALEHSKRWFAAPSSRTAFPLGDVDHARAAASVTTMLELLERERQPERLAAAIAERFDAYISVGCDDQGTVLYTAYYSPIFRASRQASGEFQHPLFRKPGDLTKDPATGAPRGGRYHDRATLTQRLKPADGFVFLPSALDAYIVGVNGSAKLMLPDGSVMYVGYEAHNGHDYVSIRQLLVADGKIGKRDGLPAIKAYFAAHPTELDGYIRRNPRFIFLQPYDGSGWPSGSLGVPVTARRSLATDKAIYPRGGLVLAATTLPAHGSGDPRPFEQWMVDQDTGGAIRAPGRADIYLGTGAEAEQLAGRQAAEGQLYYFFLRKP